MPLLTNTDEISRHIELDIFDYSFLSDKLVNVYSTYETKFKALFEQYSDAWGLDNCYFYIRNSVSCNASAIKVGEFNLINITTGYPILIDRKFQSEFFKNLLFVALHNGKEISDAYCDLYEKFGSKLTEFILECSIKFTFHHEFRHILQFNFSNLNKDFNFNEYFSSESKLRMKKHSWEYDADRAGTYRVLRFAQERCTSLGLNSKEHLKCILYIALSEIIITKNLFYFNVINDHTNRKIIRSSSFYTKKFSHPHSLVSIINVITYFIDCANDDNSSLNMDLQETVNNVLIINKLYFDSLADSNDFVDQFFGEWGTYSKEINAYNNELYEFAIRNKAIKSLLTYTGTNFGA